MSAALLTVAKLSLAWSLRLTWFLIFVLIIVPLAWLALVIFINR